ncbi:MAG: hypothetical protein US93_C0002G0050 [Candidatus Falkowbacteria bacterium GW2011_GWD2_38_42]|uniref:Sulfatase-modifying factor enzyme-like domain-containing protein n=1 Tax=Candidatus Falkowbacteria bacterium GW2011_GWE1_38_31 TaxID=1618638 RepID=A0A0G0JUE9_9BACT|nr:MAG: hypothetical protein US73_C0001G0050 [Candidatus Falkowbacteria bacterium GW2011_GWF2_38_1205]KKQ64018.1 MAG: hypothetical protein US84_C0002G0050 [Candidatus Falkowbacteria bacterium GW2011_GWF1_38_22]KKQ66634.1 MAG: hypothetical protein US87_C0001G0155 [Candidatus Falkowbacteria bacterium GW2011_GWE2_38_254]KKQ71123.1 MAG: hypothetical protein US91_C0001G0050 [Candidatus Falkowbacteria bacterium GW2011_GWE1_38_31]KKQ73249.1 MAG: hypothetical protein US93_C0002G0050 [Candidatus Falkowb
MIIAEEKMKKIFLKILKYLSIGTAAIILVSVGIDAADNYDNIPESILGKVIFGKPEGPCPEEMAFIPSENGGFCIDKYENSPNEKCQNKVVTNQSETRSNLDYADCFPVSVKNAEPWRFISQTQAIAACAKAGKRLPTSEEWFVASQGSPDKNTDWDSDDCQVDNNWPNQPGLTGTGEKCVSAFGAFDMIGNVWEWVKGEINNGMLDGRALPESGYIISADSSGLPTEINKEKADENYNEDFFWIKNNEVRGMARGGYWENKSDAGLYSMYLVSPPSFAGTGVGFRCAK